MARRRKSDEVDGCLVLLVVPIAILCAFPILLLPIAILLVTGMVISIVELCSSISANKKNKEQKKKNKVDKKLVQNNVKEADVVTEEIEDNNTTSSFYEILNICDDIEDKLLEVEVDYNEMNEDNEKLDSLYFELELYDRIINEYRNKKLVDLNEDLFDEVKECYNDFLELYNEFNLLIDKDLIEKTNNSDEISLDEAIITGAVGYGIYKKYKKEKEEQEREEYREELRNVWGLSEYEIDLVESGAYEPCQFSEEELEDDDYYGDDNV